MPGPATSSCGATCAAICVHFQGAPVGVNQIKQLLLAIVDLHLQQMVRTRLKSHPDIHMRPWLAVRTIPTISTIATVTAISSRPLRAR